MALQPLFISGWEQLSAYPFRDSKQNRIMQQQEGNEGWSINKDAVVHLFYYAKIMQRIEFYKDRVLLVLKRGRTLLQESCNTRIVEYLRIRTKKF